MTKSVLTARLYDDATDLPQKIEELGAALAVADDIIARLKRAEKHDTQLIERLEQQNANFREALKNLGNAITEIHVRMYVRLTDLETHVDTISQQVTALNLKAGL